MELPTTPDAARELFSNGWATTLMLLGIAVYLWRQVQSLRAELEQSLRASAEIEKANAERWEENAKLQQETAKESTEVLREMALAMIAAKKD